MTKTLYVLYARSDLQEPVAKHTLQALEVLSVYAFGQSKEFDIETVFLDVQSAEFAIDPETVIGSQAWLVLLVSPSFALSPVVQDGTMTIIIEDGYKQGVRIFPVPTLPVPRKAKLPWSNLNGICIDRAKRPWVALSELDIAPVNVGAPVANAIAEAIEQQLSK